MLHPQQMSEVHAEARRQRLLDEAARYRLVRSARSPRAPLPNPLVVVRALLARVRHQPLGGQGGQSAHPADGSWDPTPEVGA